MIFIFFKANSQLNPMGSMYFQNQYLANPAMAGLENGWIVNVAYKGQWSSIPGSAIMKSITTEYGSKEKKVGIGINFYNESAGVIKRMSIKGTYAYHLPLDNVANNFIDFGLSVGIMNEWIDFSKVSGNLSDNSLYNFNQRKAYIDGDFGITVRNNSMTIQASLPNLKRLLQRDMIRNVTDRSTFYSAVTYSFSANSLGIDFIEPKIAYRGVQNYKDIFDAGANFKFSDDRLLINGIYHSTGSTTFGIGTNFMNSLSITGLYTTNTSDLQNYSNGEFEIAIRYKFR